ncbi:MAG: hypothetical protein M3O46_01755 [Myxococcota bacterium]|nr:hypothetical protein [Myxococcota bacterium]
MPDPQILYIVTAVVVVGLVAWVVVVLSRPKGNESRAVAASTPVDAKRDSSGPSSSAGEQ